MAGRARKLAAERPMPPAGAPILPSMRLDFGGRRGIGPGMIKLLELIAETGSIAAAGRRLDMSYRRAWLLIHTMNETFCEPVMIATMGGVHGGGAEVTAFGHSLIDTYRAVEARLAADANAAFAGFHVRARPGPDPA